MLAELVYTCVEFPLLEEFRVEQQDQDLCELIEILGIET